MDEDPEKTKERLVIRAVNVCARLLGIEPTDLDNVWGKHPLPSGAVRAAMHAAVLQGVALGPRLRALEAEDLARDAEAAAGGPALAR